MKKSGAYLIFQMAMAVLLFAVLFGAGLYFGMSTVTSYRADQVRQEAEAIDHSLSMYSLSHQGIESVQTDSIGKVQTTKKPCYPSSLDDLGVLQTKLGYISDMVQFTDQIDVDDPGKFQYTPVLDADGVCSSYILKVKLPTGYVFTSPGSKGE